jgi:hypothetical protein
MEDDEMDIIHADCGWVKLEMLLLFFLSCENPIFIDEIAEFKEMTVASKYVLTGRSC